MRVAYVETSEAELERVNGRAEYRLIISDLFHSASQLKTGAMKSMRSAFKVLAIEGRQTIQGIQNPGPELGGGPVADRQSMTRRQR